PIKNPESTKKSSTPNTPSAQSGAECRALNCDPKKCWPPWEIRTRPMAKARTASSPGFRALDICARYCAKRVPRRRDHTGARPLLRVARDDPVIGAIDPHRAQRGVEARRHRRVAEGHIDVQSAFGQRMKYDVLDLERKAGLGLQVPQMPEEDPAIHDDRRIAP